MFLFFGLKFVINGIDGDNVICGKLIIWVLEIGIVNLNWEFIFIFDKM